MLYLFIGESQSLIPVILAFCYCYCCGGGGGSAAAVAAGFWAIIELYYLCCHCYFTLMYMHFGLQLLKF